jgi:transposase
MASWTSREELVHQAVVLRRQGMSQRAISRALDVSRNTVRKIFEAQDRQRSEPHAALAPRPTRAPRETKLGPHRGRIAELFALYPEITAQRIFEELRAAGYEGGYTQVKQHIRRVRPKPKVEPSLPTPDWKPGQMAESDWSPHEIPFSAQGKAIVQVFAYVLCFSHRKSFGLYDNYGLHALMDGHVATSERFEGLAAGCKYDGQKAVVMRWEGKQPIYNPRFLAFAAHYEFTLHAQRGNPNLRPHVERAFWEFERSFLNGRRFHDLDDMRAQLADWLDDICDTRPHKQLKRTPLAMFAEEKPHLLRLPQHPYDTARVVYRVVAIDGFVPWDGNRYAVPYEHVTDILPVRVTQREIFIYAPDLRVVARHELAPRSAGAQVGSHLAPSRRGPDLDQLRAAFDDMGEAAGDFLRALCAAAPRSAALHARQILLLRERYATDDLVAALRHVRAYGAFDHHAVARILAARSSPRTLDEYVSEQAARRIEEALGSCRTSPRDLDEYDRLPLASSRGCSEQPCPSETAPLIQTTSSSACDDTSTSSD